MFRNLSIALTLAAMAATLPAQERRSRIDVEHYTIDAEIYAEHPIAHGQGGGALRAARRQHQHRPRSS